MRVIDAEREILELLVSGMEQVGHTYGIFGFSGEVRDDVRVCVVKNLDEKFDRRRLYSLEPLDLYGGFGRGGAGPAITSGTYTGPAIRHITQLLAIREEAIRVLFLLTDSDVMTNYGDNYSGGYAQMDVHMAFLEAKGKRVHPFAISFGNAQIESLSRMYGRNFVALTKPKQLIRQMPQIYLAITR